MNYTDKQLEWINDNLTKYSESEIDELYDEMLDEVYPDCTIAGYIYSTSRALKELDPTAYRCGLSDWSSEDYTELDDCYVLTSDLDNVPDDEDL